MGGSLVAAHSDTQKTDKTLWRDLPFLHRVVCDRQPD